MTAREFEGKVAIVTGGGNGMGEQVVRSLADLGARVVIADRDPANGRRVESEVRAAGGEALFLETDATVDDSVRALVADTVRTFGALHLLDNNAAALELTADDGAIAELDPELFLASLRGDLYGPFLCCRYAIPELLASGGGSIVNMASISGFAGELSLSAYGIAKAGVLQLTRAVATQYAGSGIRCNAVAPSYVTTPNNAMYAPPELIDIYRRVTPHGDVPSPREVAAAVTFLLSDRARLVNGQTLAVDGGLGAASPIVPGYREWRSGAN